MDKILNLSTSFSKKLHISKDETVTYVEGENYMNSMRK
jgi:hypothetical protein